MHSILSLIMLVFTVIAAHPVETAAAAYIALCVANGMLPRTVIAGPVGAVLHVALDRLAVLVRRDARGTLKLPFVASVVVFVAGSLVDALEPRPVPGARTPTEPEIPAAIAPAAAPAGSRAGECGRVELGALVVLCLVTVACSGGAAAAVGAAADTASAVILVARKVRAAVCAEQLDPYLGPVRERVVVVHDVSADAGPAAVAVDAGSVE